MSSPSDEIWESFDALWRRIEQLSRNVRELETKLAALGAAEANVSENLSGIISYEGEIHG